MAEDVVDNSLKENLVRSDDEEEKRLKATTSELEREVPASTDIAEESDLVSEKELPVLPDSALRQQRGFSFNAKTFKLMNCGSYLAMATSLVASYAMKEKSVFFLNDPNVSLRMYMYGMVALWAVVLSAQGVFACIPICYETDKFNELVIQRIQYWYVASSAALIGYVFVFPVNTSSLMQSVVALSLIVSVKTITLFALYRRIKYIDEGQYYVGYIEFVCLHLMNSINNAWYTYLVLFSASNLFATLGISSATISSISGVFIVTILAEAAIYLAYYKDVFYGIFCCGILFSCFLIAADHANLLLYLTIVAGGSVVLTIMKHREKVLYMSYARTIVYYIGKTREPQSVNTSQQSGEEDSSASMSNSLSSEDAKVITEEESKGFRSLSHLQKRMTIYVKDYD